MTGAHEAKGRLRSESRARRDALSPRERESLSASVCANLTSLPAWREARSILTYLSMGSEVRTYALIHLAWEQGKLVALPHVSPKGYELHWYHVDHLDDLERSSFGVLEPPADPIRELSLSQAGGDALAVVPGLLFDRAGMRLGYGGGCYDRFLAGFSGVSCGVCYSLQLSGCHQFESDIWIHVYAGKGLITWPFFLAATKPATILP